MISSFFHSEMATYGGGGLSPDQEQAFQQASGDVQDAAIRSCGDLIRKLKSEKAAKDAIKAEVDVLLKLKGFYKSTTGQDWKPDNAPAAKKEPIVESYTGGGLSGDQLKGLESAAAEALDMKIKNCRDLILKLMA